MRRPSHRIAAPAATCFVDTSAFYALIDADDYHHKDCVGLFTLLARSRARLLTSNHVLFETYSLILNRSGATWPPGGSAS